MYCTCLNSWILFLLPILLHLQEKGRAPINHTNTYWRTYVHKNHQAARQRSVNKERRQWVIVVATNSAVQCSVQCSAVQWWYSELTAVSRGRWTTANGKRLLQWLALTAHKQAELSVGRSRSFIVIIFFSPKKKKSAHLHRALWFIHRPNKMCAHSRPCRPCTYDIPKVSMRGCYWFCIFWMFDLQLAAATTPSSLLLPSGSSSLLIQKNKEKKKKKKSTVRCC